MMENNQDKGSALNTVRRDFTKKMLQVAVASSLSAGSASLLAQTSPSGKGAPKSVSKDPATYPTKPIRMVVPYPPGGGTDVIARIVYQKMAELLGQPVVIENKGGAGGSVGTGVIAKSAPDGYSVLFTLSSHTINPAIYPRLPFDTAADFESVGMVASLPQILVAHPSAPYKDLKEYLAWGKANPIVYASVGNGSPSHLAGELLTIKSGIAMTHVPYRGAGPAVTDLLGNQISNGWMSIPAAAQHIKNGKLKGIAVSTVKRAAAFPEVMTVAEQGFPDFEVDSWFAIFMPVGVPASIIRQWNRVLNDVLAMPDIKEKLLAQGAEGVGGPPYVLAKAVAMELPKWAKLVRDANIKPD
jgi:tripartite-type tricarboxylate transporter receptor subunit TctC